ncbi:OLC1v1030362C1 [Oldenlandia corymbosa var. corymbosa]|uniref:OLC1v1030362C1 n=1 Tax=Oldenlandia corymbosa var. corymbosa TaxID=529605 RepID=A0AAV1CIX2_OLDCO|nr:OLC1v1030362C1 [Oldenlandia corymbosa var. corymbosa]
MVSTGDAKKQEVKEGVIGCSGVGAGTHGAIARSSQTEDPKTTAIEIDTGGSSHI